MTATGTLLLERNRDIAGGWVLVVVVVFNDDVTDAFVRCMTQAESCNVLGPGGATLWGSRWVPECFRPVLLDCYPDEQPPPPMFTIYG
jgi:hypothetical protein